MANIKTCFTSRFEGGKILEVDFSQLEIIYLAHITQDKQLIKDIRDGVDLHIVRAAELFSIPESRVTKEQRKKAKELSFMLQYGSGAYGMSKKTGLEVFLCKQFIDNYYRRYPRVKIWQDALMFYVEKIKEVVPETTAGGYPREESKFQSETGRIYTFKTYDTPEWLKKRGVHTGFSPQEIKNYPIQGGATGDIVPMVLGRVYRWLVEKHLLPYCKIIATVHDSIVLDIHPEWVYTIGNGVKRVMQSAPEMYEAIFGVPFDLKLQVEVKYGDSWGELTETI